MTIEVPQNKKIPGRGKNGGRKGFGSALRRRRANKESNKQLEMGAKRSCLGRS